MRKRYPYIIVMIIVILLLNSCGGALSVKDYKAWVEAPENGLVQTQIKNNIEFTVQYKPSDYVIINELQQLKIKAEDHQRLRSELAGAEYFDCRIRRVDGGPLFNDESAGMKQMYMIDFMQQDFSLIAGGDTLPCVLYHLESSGDLKPYKTLLLGFEKNQTASDTTELNLIYHDQLWGMETMSFIFTRERIKKIPQLKTY